MLILSMCVYREANRVVDGLANMGSGISFFDGVPSQLESVLAANLLGRYLCVVCVWASFAPLVKYKIKDTYIYEVCVCSILWWLSA